MASCTALTCSGDWRWKMEQQLAENSNEAMRSLGFESPAWKLDSKYSSQPPSIPEILGTENGVFTSRLPGEEDFPSNYPKRLSQLEYNVNWPENIPNEEKCTKWLERDIPPPLTTMGWWPDHPGWESVRKVTNEKVVVDIVDSRHPSYCAVRDKKKVVLKMFLPCEVPTKQSDQKILKGKGKDKDKILV